ncbi:MAG: 4Fe-4S binding protein [Anaerovoracaceae bacterium]|jgi:ech hydrogenase subunit F
MGVFKLGKVVTRSLFHKPATLMYPVIPRQWQERTRGHIEIDVSKCILCGICSRKCPTNAITVDRKARTWQIQRMQCIQCSCCVETCPKQCLSNEPEYTAPNVVKVTDSFDVPETPKKAPKKEAKADDAKAAKADDAAAPQGDAPQA